ncbi:MAG: hypothetical protein HS105_08395 [Chloracidobacterium sp.]|nr:hypothetical protein [Chloracidobacterium sp.]MCC6824808.1 hypothetical protein [Acidobacteriota bacterium]MCO5334036.1 hypothetical protein [Pyrinomonadaceae bacterium]
MDHESTNTYPGGTTVDTTIVLFLLAAEIGVSAVSVSIEMLLLTVTTLMVMVLPFFLHAWEPGRFLRWLGVRSLVLLAGVAAGYSLQGPLEYLPMTLLIPAAMVSCYLQFYFILRPHPAK